MGATGVLDKEGEWANWVVFESIVSVYILVSGVSGALTRLRLQLQYGSFALLLLSTPTHLYHTPLLRSTVGRYHGGSFPARSSFRTEKGLPRRLWEGGGLCTIPATGK